MSTTKKTYLELKAELEAEIAWFEGSEATVEAAVEHYKKAKQILKELEKILETAELEIKKIS